VRPISRKYRLAIQVASIVFQQATKWVILEN